MGKKVSVHLSNVLTPLRLGVSWSRHDTINVKVVFLTHTDAEVTFRFQHQTHVERLRVPACGLRFGCGLYYAQVGLHGLQSAPIAIGYPFPAYRDFVSLSYVGMCAGRRYVGDKQRRCRRGFICVMHRCVHPLPASCAPTMSQLSLSLLGEEAASPVCDRYRGDMAHFGYCKCGRRKSEHAAL